CLDVVPVDVCLWPGTVILNCQADGYPDVNDNGSEQKQTNYPKQRAEVAQVLRVTIDPVGADKNLQIAKQMPDHKEDQNDARDRDNHFFPNRRAIKSCQNIHVTSRRRSSGARFRLWMRLGASRVVPASDFPLLANRTSGSARAGKVRGRENCSSGRRGDPIIGPQSKQSQSFT